MSTDASARVGPRAGPAGRGLRLLVGVGLVVEGVRHLVGAPAGLLLSSLAVVAGAVVVYALIHFAIVRFPGRVNRWAGAVLALAPVVATFAAGGAPGQLGSMLFVGASLLLAAARADRGCEVMALPGLLSGRRTHLVCLAFSPIDWLEEAWVRR